MKKTATFVKTMSGFAGDAGLYKLSPKAKYTIWKGVKEIPRSTSYVIVSAVDVFGKPETYIFPASAKGCILNWGELSGSFKGGLDHKKALNDAGYEVTKGVIC